MMTEEKLEELLAAPRAADVEAMRALEGPLLILGAAGKMGPSLAHLARRALDEAGKKTPVIAVSRFSTPESRGLFERWGIETIGCDMLEPGALERLPDAPNVIFMAARKFGSTGNPSLTWAANVLLPGLVAVRYRESKIVAFSSGNVYPLVPVESGGATEETAVGPVGEYAQSVLGRERLFEHGSLTWGTPVALLRLNYAVEMRYGVLVDIGRKVQEGRPVDLTMGHVNVMWQGDANSVTLRSLAHCASPPFILNLTGEGTLRVRDIAAAFARRFGKEAVLTGEEAPTALLNNAARCHELFGRPGVSAGQMIDWIADWIEEGGRLLNKPTHFENREGKF
ncbi:MAG: NAD(P)-dependent oxidoreductase [Candidatus Solibacter usitatus]|nr:NAD(P)-dependent oxidoreductase [Candidatus Solibacter usitatus]